MQTVKKFITLASTQLNDQRYNRAFNRWGRDLLLQYLNLGISEIAAYFPKDFTAKTQITLKPGAAQDVALVGGIVSLDSNADGSKIAEMSGQLATAFGQYSSCPADISFVNGNPMYKVISFSIDEHNSKSFVVDPPVPEGMSPVVNATIDQQAPQFTLENWNDELSIPQKYIAPLMGYVLGSALQVNAESQISQRESADHFNSFYSVLGINYKQSSRFKSGYYEGKRGDGDLRVVRP